MCVCVFVSCELCDWLNPARCTNSRKKTGTEEREAADRGENTKSERVRECVRECVCVCYMCANACVCVCDIQRCVCVCAQQKEEARRRKPDLTLSISLCGINA